MKWIHFKNVFSKRKLKTIQAIEYIKEGCLIRMSKKLEIEIEIMKKNKARFKLAYNSLIFYC